MNQSVTSESTGNVLTTGGSQATDQQTQQTSVQSTIPWLEGADELTLGYVQNKGWTEPKQVLEGYRNLEKLLGADKAGSAVILPKEGASPEEKAAFYNRLGRPETPDGYKIPTPEGSDPEFAKQAANKFHELGLTKAQAENLSEWWGATSAQQQQAQIQAQHYAVQQQDTELRREWGAAFDQNLATAKKAVTGLGLNAEAIDKISAALGHKETLKLFANIGGRVLEDGFVSGDKGNTSGTAMTPAQAKAQIDMLRKDSVFVSQYLNKQTDAVEKMQRLMSYAYPEGV